jgi:hypothetical protein
MEKKIIWTECDLCNLDNNNGFLDIEKYNLLPTFSGVERSHYPQSNSGPFALYVWREAWNMKVFQSAHSGYCGGIF